MAGPPATQTPAQIAAAAASTLAKARRQKGNELACVYFAGAMLGFIVLFTLLQWVDAALKTRPSKNNGPFSRKLVSGSRFIQSIMIRKITGFSSVGHALLFIVYLAVNICVSFQDVDRSAGTLNNWAKRIGWITASNLALLTFLGLKNTPLALLTSQSYEKLNLLHQAAGYTTIGLMLVHSLVYIAAWSASHSLEELEEQQNVMGIVAGISMLTIFVTTLLLRKLRYEAFYVVHIALFMLIVIGVAMHRPKPTTNTIWIPIFTGAIWIVDRIVRFGKLAFYAYGNDATITPLPNGGVRITLKRSTAFKSSAVPGYHAFLWIPQVRAFETHPFTITSTSPLEFVIAAHDGFTKDLLSYATANPGTILRASMDGPYGALPNFDSYDKIVLIAGGSGGSFTFGVASNLLAKIVERKAKTILEFIYVVREHECMSWFADELAELNASSSVKLTVHVTRSNAVDKKDTGISSSGDAFPATGSSLVQKTATVDVEKSSLSSSSSPLPLQLVMKPGRPNLAALIKVAVESAEAHERVMITACGPPSLMAEARRTAAACAGSSGKAVDFFGEEFGC